MRRLAIAIVVLVVLFGAVLVAAFLYVSPEELRVRLEREITATLGRDTRVAGLELALFPLPAAHVTGLRIAGDSALLPPFAEIDSVRLRLALWPLLRGQVALASLTLERPRFVVPLDREGRPILPRPAATKAGSAQAPSADAGAAAALKVSAENAAAGAALLAIDAIHVREGSARVGRYRFESIELDGRLRSAGRAEVTGSLELLDVGRIHDLDLELDGLGAPEWTALASARLDGGDLPGLMRVAGIGPGLAGKFDLEVDALRLVNLAPRGGQLRARLRGLDVRTLLAGFDGDVALDADVGGAWKLDLADAGIRYGGYTKPRGTPLALEGPFPEDPARSLRARVLLPGNAVDFVAHYGGNGAPRLEISPTALALEPLAPILGWPVAGTLELAPSTVVFGQTPSFAAKATLEEVSYPVGETTAFASGEVTLDGVRWSAPSLRVRVAEQPFDLALSGSLPVVPWAMAFVETRLRGAGLDVEALAVGLLGNRDFSGTATLASSLRSPLQEGGPSAGLEGDGRIEIAPGRIRGFSLLRQTFGELAALPIAIGALRGKDLARYEEEEFQSLTADYTVSQGRLATRNLKIVYRNATAELAGDVGLYDGALRLAGRLLLSREVDATLGPAPDAKPRVIPIAGIGGTVTNPRVQLDQDAVLAIGAALSGSERIKKQLDEKLGPGAGEAVEEVLDLLRGEPKPPDPAP